VPIRIGIDLVPSPLASLEGFKRDQVRAWLLQNWADSVTFQDSRHSARVRAVHSYFEYRGLRVNIVNYQPARKLRRYKRIQGDAARFGDGASRGQSGEHTGELSAADLLHALSIVK